jgi:hypothetical protein
MRRFHCLLALAGSVITARNVAHLWWRRGIAAASLRAAQRKGSCDPSLRSVTGHVEVRLDIHGLRSCREPQPNYAAQDVRW